MKNNIAILQHSVNPIKQHHFCSAGKLSWCKWQQDVAIGIKTYQGDDCLPKVFLKLLHPRINGSPDTGSLNKLINTLKLLN